MDLKVVYAIWPDGDSPDKAYTFTSVAAFDEARCALHDAGVSYGYAVLPILGDEDTLKYLKNEMIKGENK